MSEPAGYSGTPLIKKLGIKPDYALVVVDPPENYWDLLGDLPEGVAVREPGEDAPLDFLHLFVTSKADLERSLPLVTKQVKPQGMIWVSWPKKSSGRWTGLTEDLIREVALFQGLVDVKVCAVDEIWSGLKLVTRLKDRGSTIKGA